MPATVTVYGPGLIRKADGSLLRIGASSLVGKCTVTHSVPMRRWRVTFDYSWVRHDLLPPSYAPVETSGTSSGNVRFVNVFEVQTPEYSDLLLSEFGDDFIAIRVYYNGTHTVTVASAYRSWPADLTATPPVYAGDYTETLGTVTITLEQQD